MSFEVARPLKVGDDCFLELRYRDKVVNLAANIRWCSSAPPSPAAEEAPACRAGGAFTEVLAEDPEGLWRALIAQDAVATRRDAD